LEFSRATRNRKRVVVSHSEILKLEEEARLMTVVADDTLDAAAVASDLGRFSEGKLELATTSSDLAVSARAQSLLDQLRAR
jgi:tRNA C32,U32 (ribose-2'-O)-methylase TrmJ